MARALPSDEDIFQAARRIEAGTARDAYLVQACGKEAALREQVAALLRAHEESPSYLEAPMFEVAGGVSSPPTLDHPSPEKPVARIGPYKLLQQIGEGGFGIVFMAEQLSPVRRKVALKLIK